MTRKYTLVIEGKPGAYGAYVPELQTILVTGRTLAEIKTRAKEAIELWWEHAPRETKSAIRVKEIEVELPNLPNATTQAALLQARDPQALKRYGTFRELRGRS